MSENNSLIKVVEIQNKGRALVSGRPLKAGEIVLKDSPILLYSALPLPHEGSTEGTPSYCSHCFRTISRNSPTTVCCPNCSTATIFCSSQCQSAALSISHTPFVCQSLARLCASDSPLLHHPHDRHLQARFLVSAYNLAILSSSHFQTLLMLQGDTINDDETVHFLHALISSLGPFSSLGSSGFSMELTATLLAKDKLNAFGLMEPYNPTREKSVRGYGIYPRASFFNHDCLPNACRFDYVDSVPDSTNVDIIVRVIHDIPEGREISLSYFPVNLRYMERQKRLKEDYGFICDCDRCKVEARWSDNEEEDDEEMDQDEVDMDDDTLSDVQSGDSGMDQESNDFPHAYFFATFVCENDNCWGTCAPVPPANDRPSTLMECNVCGRLSNGEI